MTQRYIMVMTVLWGPAILKDNCSAFFPSLSLWLDSFSDNNIL